VLHAAGALRDKLLRAMPLSDIGICLSPKAGGACNAYRTTVHVPLELHILFSSITSAFGNIGQANYAAANSYSDSLAPSYRMQGRCGLSLQIPVVSGAGMSASTFDDATLDAIGATIDQFGSWLASHFARKAEAGVCVQTLLPVQVLAMSMGPSTLASEIRMTMTTASLKHSNSGMPAPGVDALPMQLAGLALPERLVHVESLVVSAVHELINTPGLDICPETSFAEIGMDSIASRSEEHHV
jgi:hypothetical protein